MQEKSDETQTPEPKNQCDLTLDFLTEEKDNLLIVGGGGTGKSTLIRKWLEEDDTIVPVTPTGVSAVNLGMGATTAHSGCSIPMVLNLYDHIDHQVPVRMSQTRKDTWRAATALLIDEISMIRSDVLDYMDYVLRSIRYVSKPFGGLRIVMVGDPFQLSPVVKGNEGLNRKWFFESRVWHQLEIMKAELTEIHRQSDVDFKECLSRIRLGLHTMDDIKYLNSHKGKWNEESLVLAATNQSVNNINERKIGELEGDDFISHMIVQGNFKAKDCRASEKLVLKRGARVVFIKNKYNAFGEPTWINGTTGVVKDFYGDIVQVKIDDGDTVEVVRETWESMERKYEDGKWKTEVTGKCFQFPIKLGFASTIHSAQSLTLKKLFFKNTNMFSAGQAYTALSRATGPEALTLEHSMNPRDIKVDAKVIDWYRREINSI